MTLRIFCVVVTIALFASLGGLAHLGWENFWWKQEVDTLARYEGGSRALHDFQSDKVRLFVISGEHDGDTFSGSNQGPFEIWFPQYYTNAPFPMRYSMEHMVQVYDEKMRSMQKHPARFSKATNGQVTRTTNSPSASP